MSTGSIRLRGSSLFRSRIVGSILSGKTLFIRDIRSDSDAPGLVEYEASFLRLIEKIMDGCAIQINETGTVLKFKPGIITGGQISHDCGTTRSIGWFIEGIIPLVVFAKVPVVLMLTGITNDALDLSVDILRNVTLPLMRNFGIEGMTVDVKRRGAAPNGGGLVEFRAPIVRELRPLNVIDCGLIKRIRGVAFCAKISPTILTRVVESARQVLNDYIPDVYIHTDHYRGKDSGASAGYSLSLFAGNILFEISS
jgi:RNA 3'-terminal phosphate cyclase-like protein